MRTCVITGGAGFIGSSLSERLLSRGDKVKIIDNFFTGKKENIRELTEKYPKQLEVIEGDIRDLNLLRSQIKGADYVFHQGAIPSVRRSVDDPATSNEVNVQGTLNVLIASREASVKRVINASSSAIYGDSPTLPKTESFSAHPISPYGLTKYVAEEYCRLFHTIYKLETVSLRYFNVFGPRQDPTSEYSAVIPKFICNMLRGLAPVIYGDGEQSRDFTYVANVVEANMLAAEAEGVSGDYFNIACGEQKSLNQLVEDLNEILGTRIRPRFDKPREGDIKHSLADIEKAKRRMGYEPSVAFIDGLRKSIEWYVKTLS